MEEDSKMFEFLKFTPTITMEIITIVKPLNIFYLFRDVIPFKIRYSQPAITCSNLTIETLEQGVKYVQS